MFECWFDFRFVLLLCRGGGGWLVDKGRAYHDAMGKGCVAG
jgi:hypothetical protein